MKVLVATEKPFAKVAIDGIKQVLDEAGYEMALLEKYTDKKELLDAVVDADAIIIRSDIIDAEVWEFLQQVFNVIKYAGPILCLVLSVADFIKATASQDKDALVNAGKTTGKRVMYAIILFFIPTLIDFLFPLLGWVGTCGIG